jgi:aldose 1-epimerase
MNPTILSLLLMPLMMQAGNYSAQRVMIEGFEVIQLKDSAHKIEVSVVPSLGNNAYEIKANGKHVLWSPYQNLKESADKPVQLGNPLLAPWANRIQGDGYWANGRRYLLNPELRNFRYDSNKNPIHGLLVYAREWKVIRVQADGRSASVTSRLEF